MNKAEKGRFFHERLQNVTFDGFSGRVRFTNGDRAEEQSNGAYSRLKMQFKYKNVHGQNLVGILRYLCRKILPSPFQPTCTAMNLALMRPATQSRNILLI